MSEDNDADVRGRSPGTFPMVWIGRSGRRYALEPAPGEGHIMAPDRLYALIEADRITWVGTADELISDQASRARFRRAATQWASLVWHPAPVEELELMTLAWDLDGTARGNDKDAA